MPIFLSPSTTLNCCCLPRYGQYLGLLESSVDHCKHLSQLLAQVCGLWTRERHAKIDTSMGEQWYLLPTPHIPFLYSFLAAFLKGACPYFDWFSCSVYLLMQGSSQDCLSFLTSFSTLLGSMYMWHPRPHLSVWWPWPHTRTLDLTLFLPELFAS